MAEVRWARQATEDLDSIVAFLSKDSPRYASLFVLDIFAAVDRVIDFPRSGRVVPELDDPQVREVILGTYRLVYRVRPAHLVILTIHHGARLFKPERLG